jgi:hypothetical protein
MAINSRGTDKCPACGKHGSLYQCNKCNDKRCWSCLQKIGLQTSWFQLTTGL